MPVTALLLGALLALACDAADRPSESKVAAPEIPGAPPAPPSAISSDFAGGDASAPRRGTPGSRTEEMQSRPDAAASAADPAAAAQGSATSMIIRTGNAVIEVDSLEPAVAALRLLAQRLGGFVANTTIQTGREQLRQATLELKIPAQRFDEAISGLSPLGKVEGVNIGTEDVGEEFVDITARVANARRLEDRLVTLLATRTGKLEDVLAVERELARVREEIERYEGRLRYLRQRVAVSTLTVTLHEPLPLVGANPGRSVIGEAFKNAWRNFVSFVAWLIEATGILIPLAAIGLVVWWLWRRFGAGIVPPRRGRGPREGGTPES
jgi:hypothetical protein